MKRKALIITNPGDEGTENYCQGVNVDNSEYKKFLMSEYGGAWISTNPNNGNNEIIELYKPTLSQLRLELISIKLARVEYLLVIFCGHGYYNQQNQCSMLELQTGIDVPETIFHDNAPKTCIILDSCRVYDMYFNSHRQYKVYANKIASYESRFLRFVYRCIYNNKIMQKNDGLLTVYSCALSQSAHEVANLGGDFSCNLRNESDYWIGQQKILSQYSRCSKELTIMEIFPSVQQKTRQKGNNQIPQVYKSNVNIDFPWCVFLSNVYINAIINIIKERKNRRNK